MIDPALVDTISGLGSLGFAILAVWAFVSRRVRTPGEMADALGMADARLSEMRADRDAWRGIAESFGAKMDRQTDVIESLVGGRIT